MGGPGSGRKPTGRKLTVSVNGRKKTFSEIAVKRASLKHRGRIFQRLNGSAAVKKLTALRKKYLGKGGNAGKGNDSARL